MKIKKLDKEKISIYKSLEKFSHFILKKWGELIIPHQKNLVLSKNQLEKLSHYLLGSLITGIKTDNLIDYFMLLRYRAAQYKNCEISEVIFPLLYLKLAIFSVIIEKDGLNSKYLNCLLSEWTKMEEIFILETIETYNIYQKQALVSELSKWKIDKSIGIVSFKSNSSTLSKYLCKKIQEAKKYNNLISLLLIDVDNLGQYDKEIAEYIIKRVVKIGKNILKNFTHNFIHYGSDMFVIVLFGKDKFETLKIAEKIRGKIEKDKLSKNIKYTISTGICIYPIDASSERELFLKADEALFEAKKKGKNKIVYFSPRTYPPGMKKCWKVINCDEKIRNKCLSFINNTICWHNNNLSCQKEWEEYCYGLCPAFLEWHLFSDKEILKTKNLVGE
jgi:diguanylate cyclase (GGDEF)-like protein